MLTYDTTLQVVTRTAQQDLFLHGRLLGGHFLAFLLAAIRATGRRIGRRRREEGNNECRNSRTEEKRGTSRTSCRSEKNEGGGSRIGGCPLNRALKGKRAIGEAGGNNATIVSK